MVVVVWGLKILFLLLAASEFKTPPTSPRKRKRDVFAWTQRLNMKVVTQLTKATADREKIILISAIFRVLNVNIFAGWGAGGSIKVGGGVGWDLFCQFMERDIEDCI